jgi:hypothetical protein
MADCRPQRNSSRFRTNAEADIEFMTKDRNKILRDITL